MRRGLAVAVVLALAAASPSAAVAPAADDPASMRSSLRQALAAQRLAEARGLRLEREAQAAGDAAARAGRQAAALAARIQQAEAGIAAAEARVRLIDRERGALRETLGRRQQPVARLVGALQQFSRRPLTLTVLRPGSVRDVVYTRALLASAVPQVQSRTQALRAALARGRALRVQAQQAAVALRAEQGALAERRRALASLEARQQLAARAASGSAGREAERALVLAEQARDLDALVGELDRAGALRRRLAALPGPMLRPADPTAARAPQPAASVSSPDAMRPPQPYLLPVTGRTVAGFGVPDGAGVSQGLTLAPRAGAQVVAPAAGRVAFAGSYRGYGRIVIVEHAGGWTSLVTGLAQTSVGVGEELIGGTPLGTAAARDPAITLELRREGTPVDPLPFIG
ncbi:MAG: metalloendopeptidase [Sphingomonadales bacterium 32-68-7]|nr:MAG: metalloendopeptidase [Sphingomonadales bacterium 12-68-11]OYX09776.1 MAG: metalloendopeptidase [Sphingomonadales bacterium 32-68-7]